MEASLEGVGGAEGGGGAPVKGEGTRCEFTVQHEYSNPTKRAISSETGTV